MKSRCKLAVFASGSGTNAEAIFKYFQHHAEIEVVLLLSNNPEAYALQRAAQFTIATKIFNRIEYKESEIVLEWLREYKVTHVVLAGFLWLIPSYLIHAFPNRIINIHPALLPLHGGKGMYGLKVHQAVKASGVNETGITIHIVNEKYDEGKILFQGKCSFDGDSTAEEIAECVHALEHKHYPAVIEQWINTSFT